MQKEKFKDVNKNSKLFLDLVSLSLVNFQFWIAILHLTL